MTALTDLPKIETTALAPLSIKDTVLAQFAEAERTVTALAEKYKRVAYDCATTKGMADAKAARLDLRENGRYAVQRAEAKVKGEVNDLKRVMAVEVERLVGIVRPVEEAIDAQIKAREEQLAAEKAERERQAAEAARLEAERKQRLEDGIATLAGYVQKAQGKTAAAMAAGIAFVEAIVIDPAHWQEYTERAAGTLASTLQALRAMHATQVKAEADAAELEALRREKAEREARERAQAQAEAARKAAEERAAREKAEAEARAAEALRQQQDAERAAAQAESERLEQLAAENRARAEAAAVAASAAPAPAPAPGRARFSAATRAPAVAAPAPSVEEPATLKLEDINFRLALLKIDADGLAELGINPAKTEGAAKLYRESDYARLLRAIADYIAALMACNTMRECHLDEVGA